MTTDEIKQSVSMREVVEQYGYHPNRAGFISCPFHKEKTASMKVYKDSVYCFGCGRSGDIFTFVQQMDGCSFKEAYLKLGGEYEKKSDWQRKKFEYQLQQKKEKRGKNWNVSGNGREKYCRTYQCKSYLLNAFQFFPTIGAQQ